MIHPSDFWPTLRKQLEDAIESRTAVLASGGEKTFEDYKLKAGELSGLRMALTLGQELATGKPPKASEKPNN